MNSIPWWVQAIAAGVLSAGGVAAGATQLDMAHLPVILWSVAWAGLGGFASYVLGKFQQPPTPKAK